jgi:hypothetical protein
MNQNLVESLAQIILSLSEEERRLLAEKVQEATHSPQALVLQKKLTSIDQEKLAFFTRFFDSFETYFESQTRLALSPEPPLNDDQRQLLVSSLRGKYAHTSTSSDEFAQKKQEEIDWENRAR